MIHTTKSATVTNTLLTVEPGKQQYTLLSAERKSDGTFGYPIICTYGMNGAILTTDLDALIEYTRNLVLHWGVDRVYTISTVTEMMEVNSGITEWTDKHEYYK